MPAKNWEGTNFMTSGTNLFGSWPKRASLFPQEAYFKRDYNFIISIMDKGVILMISMLRDVLKLIYFKHDTISELKKEPVEK